MTPAAAMPPKYTALYRGDAAEVHRVVCGDRAKTDEANRSGNQRLRQQWIGIRQHVGQRMKHRGVEELARSVEERSPHPFHGPHEKERIAGVADRSGRGPGV